MCCSGLLYQVSTNLYAFIALDKQNFENETIFER